MLEMQRGFISCFIPRLINGAEWEMALSASLFNRTKKLFAFVPQASERALRIQTWVSQRSNLGQSVFKPGSVSVQTWVSQRSNLGPLAFKPGSVNVRLVFTNCIECAF